MTRFRFRGVLSDVDIQNLVATQPRLSLFRERLEAQGVRPQRARTLVERLVVAALDDFGSNYEGVLSHHIDAIVRIREEISTKYERVLELSSESPFPSDLQANDLQRLFNELEGHLDAVSGRSPIRHLEGADSIDTPTANLIVGDQGTVSQTQSPTVSTPSTLSPALREAGLTRALGEQLEVFQNLDPQTRSIIGLAAELVPDELRAAVGASERDSLSRSLRRIETRIREEGAGDAEVNLLNQAVERLNAQRRAASVDRLLLASAIGRISDSRLRAEVGQAFDADSPSLALLAHENMPRLLELWSNWLERREQLRSPDFKTYVRRRQNEPRGQLGEFGAAFQLGENFALLKSPDYDINLPGTDLVAVNLQTFEVLIIDNKAFRRREVGRVGALTRNILINLRNDVQNFKNAFPSGADVPLQIHAAVNRLDRALQQIDSEFGPDHVPTTEVAQRRISEIFADNEIRRVVTGAGGEVEGVRSGLERRGVTFQPLE